MAGWIDERPVAVDRGVDRQLARGEKRLASTGAVPDGADLPVADRQPTQVAHRAAGVAEELLGRDPSAGARRGGRVVGSQIRSEAVIEVRADRDVAVIRESARDLLGRLVPAGRVVDDEHSRERSRSERPGEIGADLVVTVTR